MTLTHIDATTWFRSLAREDRKEFLALLHEIRRDPIANPDLPQAIRRARSCDRFQVLLQHLEADHDAAGEAGDPVPLLRFNIHGLGDHGSTVGVCPDPYCCPCECSGCKRTWFAVNRPNPRDCPTHGKKP